MSSVHWPSSPAAVFWNDKDVRYMQELPWLWATDAQLGEMGLQCRESRIFKIRASQELYSGYERALFAARKAEVVERGYTILQGSCDFNHSFWVEAKASANDLLHTLSSFPTETLEQLQHLEQSTFQKQGVAPTAVRKRIWSLIANNRD